ncbi:MAG: cation:proton antiporter [Deltaproteobacteria bacterium]|nr:cation:proton antiporter [Deltaproteobacteria bacterium]
MHSADLVPLIAGLMILVSSMISLRFGISVAVIEILIGVLAGTAGLEPADWMIYFAGFGGIILTFLAGAEVDLKLLKEKFSQSLLIGLGSFGVPLVFTFIYTYFWAGWSLNASLIAGVAMSETSIAVVYSVLLETGLIRTQTGKTLMAATFITNTGTALMLSILFAKLTLYMWVFIIVSIGVIYLATRFSHLVFENPVFKNKVVEPELKYIFALLLVFIYFANLGGGHAILPAFLLGLFMSRHFAEVKTASNVKGRIRIVAFSLITPVFFIVVGMKVQLFVVLGAFVMFFELFIIKQVSKFLGVYFIAKKIFPQGDDMYSTLLLSTGLTFGLIALMFGLKSEYITQTQYSVLTAVLIASAVVPTFIAQKWFMPRHLEDINTAPDKDGK